MPYFRFDASLPADTALPWRCVPTNRRSAKAGRRVDVRDALGRIVANYVLPEVGALLCAAGNATESEEDACARARRKPSSERTLEDWQAMGV